jgi:hypothetical protein
MNIRKSLHYLSFIFVLFGFDQVQAFLGIQFGEDWPLYIFFVPWFIFGVVDNIINRDTKHGAYPWQRKDADKKVVNDERDSF